MDLNEEKEIVALEKKLKDQGVERLRGMSLEELEFTFLELSKHAQEIVSTMNKDEQYQSAKELVTEMAGPYRDQSKMNKIKSRFVHLIIKEKKGE